MKTFPAFHALTARKVVIAGSGEAAASKARLAAASGARILFVGAKSDAALIAEFGGAAGFLLREAETADFTGAALVFVSTDDREKAARLAAMARAAGAPVNVVDQPDLSDFITPSIVDRGEVVVAVSTHGAAPALAQKIRSDIEKLLPARIGALAAFARALRPRAARLATSAGRRRFWRDFFDGPAAARFLDGDEAGARAIAERALGDSKAYEPTGIVHIVGAGPGDGELLTLRALRLIKSADVIYYDRLIGEDILSYARRDAQKIHVGKTRADHAVPQGEIETRLIESARAGKIVVRLKGGDPFIFGRGGEEVDALRDAGVAFTVTPGITAATGCAASAAMPLTHRDLSQAVTFVTGHARGEADPDIDWRALARLGHTIVVYMGVNKAGAIARNLLRAGLSGATPVAVIEKGTTVDERVAKGALSQLGALVVAARIEGPALLVIGAVAAKASSASIINLAGADTAA